jgi:ribosomal protein S18 acetylase RimI-like enzyme
VVQVRKVSNDIAPRGRNPAFGLESGGRRFRDLGSSVRHCIAGLVGDARMAVARTVSRRGSAETSVSPPLDWREALRPEDAGEVRRMVEETAMFTNDEADVAVELVDERLAKGPSSGYDFLFAQRAGRSVGYACFGPIPGAPGRWDLYWIVVRPEAQHGGVGRDLLRRAEALMSGRGAERIYIDTSTSKKYTPTRAFYRAMGYRKVAELPDFFHDGDGKAIFMRRCPPPATQDRTLEVH